MTTVSRLGIGEEVRRSLHELARSGRTRALEDIEREQHIVRMDFSGERWGYSKSEYYEYEDPVVLRRRAEEVERFLSRIAASLKE